MAKKEKAVNKLTIKTAKLQDMVSRVVKGAKNDKVLPITQMMAIRLQDNVLTLITTSVTTTMYIREEKVDGNDFYVVVPVDVFSKLISKLTCENITLEVNAVAGSVEIKGNGTYHVPIEFDEDNEMVVFPDPLEDCVFDEDETVIINTSTIRTILTTLKPAVATTLEEPQYTGYYFGDKVIATNGFLINSLDVNLFDTEKLISAGVLDLLDVMTAEKISVDFKESEDEGIPNIIVFGSLDCTIYTRELEGIEDFESESITQVIDTPFTSMCKLMKNALLQLLDRVQLFVSDYDEGIVNFTFTKDGLQVTSKMSNAVELIPYTESTKFKPFMCSTDVGLIIKQVKSQPGEIIELWYGDDSVIKIVRDKVTQIIALHSEAEEEGEEEDVDAN